MAKKPDIAEFLVDLFSASPTAYAVYDTEGFCRMANAACDRLFGGLPPPDYNIFNDENATASGVDGLIRKAFAGETIKLPPLWYDRRAVGHPRITEGKRVAVETTFYPLHDKNGTVQYVVVHARDATSEMATYDTNEELRQREEELAATLRSIGDGVIATDAQGHIVRMNPVAENATGWSIDEAKARPLEEVLVLVNETTRKPVQNPVEEVLKKGAVVGLANHTVLIARNGTEIAIADSAAPILGLNGQVRGVVMVFRDVSNERREETLKEKHARELRNKEKSLQRSLSVSRTVAWSIDFLAKTMSVSDNVAEVLGFSAPFPAPLDTLVRHIHPEDRPGSERRLANLSDGLHGPLRVVRFVRPDNGEIVWAESRAEAEYDVEGKTIGANGLLVDVAERKRGEDAIQMAREAERRNRELLNQNHRIQEASRLKSEFLAHMSHELRTPLNAIIGFTELLYDHHVEPHEPQYREFLGSVLKNGQHLLHLINEVLDLSKIEAGMLEIRLEKVNLAAVVDEVCAAVRGLATRKNIRIETRVDPGLSEIVTDPSRFKQILYNYVSNAIKFTNDGGLVNVRAEAHDADTFRIEVEDNGVGIATEDLGRLFIEFEQLEGSYVKKHGGTGLGLALTKRLVTAFGGTVGVRSELGKGSVFYAILPRSLPASWIESSAIDNE